MTGQQLSLDDVTGMHRATDPDTSTMAAVIAIGHARTDYDRVLELLNEHGPLSDFALARHTGRKQTSIGKRRGELVELGYVERARDTNGCWAQGVSDTGSPCALWQITDAGVAARQAGITIQRPRRPRRPRRPKPQTAPSPS